ncbi:hypothetical protein NMY22_g16777 [Coprinellus aureogranulatus]|nr:hypothetical protein NMY22_g16777 [Coprinellus aureogranulatus]
MPGMPQAIPNALPSNSSNQDVSVESRVDLFGDSATWMDHSTLMEDSSLAFTVAPANRFVPAPGSPQLAALFSDNSGPDGMLNISGGSTSATPGVYDTSRSPSADAEMPNLSFSHTESSSITQTLYLHGISDELISAAMYHQVPHPLGLPPYHSENHLAGTVTLSSGENIPCTHLISYFQWSAVTLKKKAQAYAWAEIAARQTWKPEADVSSAVYTKWRGIVWLFGQNRVDDLKKPQPESNNPDERHASMLSQNDLFSPHRKNISSCLQ